MTGTEPSSNARSTGSDVYPGRSLPAAWLLGLAGLYLLLRLPHCNHLLAWDEAWNLEAIKALASGDSTFISRYWVHPPLYVWVAQLLAPLKAGLELRLQIFNLALGSATLIVFVACVAGLFGRWIALYTGLAWALLPGAIFFDAWLKRDPLVALLGVAALSAWFSRRAWLAGVLLGLGLLAKENAVFFCGALLLLIISRHRSDRRLWREIGLVFGLAFLVAIGGYVWMFARPGIGQENLKYFLGSTEGTMGFARPWWYYFAKLRLDLGWLGLAFLVAGLAALIPRTGAIKNFSRHLARPRMLPVYLLAPGYLILSLSTGKPSWMTIVLQPGLALLIGLGWAFVWQRLVAAAGRERVGLRPARTAGLVLLPILLGWQLAGFSYNDYFEKISPNQFLVSRISSEIVALLNDQVGKDEVLLIMPMQYRNNPNYPDPIVYHSLKSRPRILRSMNPDLNPAVFRSLVASRRVDWVLMAPEAGSRQAGLVRWLISEMDATAYLFSRGILIRVRELWDRQSFD